MQGNYQQFDPQQGAYPQQGYPQQGQPQQGQFQQGYQPQQYMQQQGQFGGGGMMQMNGLSKLAQLPGIYVKQKFELLEAMTGCETENKYNIAAADSNGDKQGNPVFKAKEKSDCFARNCCKGAMRPFKINIEDEQTGDIFLKLDREFQCTIWCCNRPEVVVSVVENGVVTQIGRVVNPFQCCSMKADIYDLQDSEVPKYSIVGSSCQLGVICKCPCDACQTIDFDLNDKSGNKLSTFQKRSRGCLKAMMGDADAFSMYFPQDATPYDKCLLLASIFLIDYMYFEESAQGGEGGNGGFN